MAVDIDIHTKTFPLADGGVRKVFEHFSLRIDTGKVTAALGPSGCGKSTLLRMIAGLDRDFSGGASSSSHLPGPRIGMAFQEPRLLPWRSIADNLRLAAPALSQAALDKLLATFELEGRGGDFPGQLSLGLARRAALARAFAVEPELLLLDEPFASLDRALHLRLRDLLAGRFDACAMTVLIATHDLDDALLLADEVIFLEGEPARIVHRLRLTAPRGERENMLPDLRRQAAFRDPAA